MWTLEISSHSQDRKEMQELLIQNDLIETENEKYLEHHKEEFDYLAQTLQDRGFDIIELVNLASDYSIAVPSWGTGTGGTRFA